MPKKYPDHEYLKKNLNWEYPSKIEWDLTNGPLSSSTLRFGGPFSRSCWRFLGEYCPETPSSTVLLRQSGSVIETSPLGRPSSLCRFEVS